MKETDLQKQCNEYLRENGILFYHRQKGRSHKQTAQSAGLPDLLVWNNHCFAFIELKTDVGRLSEDQEEFAVKASRAGFKLWIARSFEDFLEALRQEGII